MDAHNQIDNEPDIEFDEEYEIKAMKAYIAKKISSADLQVHWS